MNQLIHDWDVSDRERMLTFYEEEKTMCDEKRIELQGGKYTYIYDGKGGQKALRYGEEWRDLCGDNFVYTLAARIGDLEEVLKAARSERQMHEVFVGANGEPENRPCTCPLCNALKNVDEGNE